MVTVAWLFSLTLTHPHSSSLFLSLSPSFCARLSCLLRLLRVALCGSVAYSFSLRYNNEACQNVSLSNKAGTVYQWHQLTLLPLPTPPLSLAKKQEKSAQCCVCPTDVASIASLSLSFSFPFSFSTRVVAVCLLLWQQFIK